MSPDSLFDNGYWTYLYILIAGWLVTDVWRWLGVLIGNRLSNDSEVMYLVRSIATALVAAVIAQMILYPSGALSTTPVWLRIGACAIGFSAFLLSRQQMIVGIVVAEVVLFGGLFAIS
ncbi:AzlD domain-containing protein [Hoeflea sp. CAU 1731]